MIDNIRRTAIACLALVALAGAPGAAAEQEPTPQSLELTWDWLPASADAFLDGIVGNMCSGGTYELGEQELQAVFPVLAEAQGKLGEFERVAGVQGCAKLCTCGTCLVLAGAVACMGCYACCTADEDCELDCDPDPKGVTWSGDCRCVPRPDSIKIRDPPAGPEPGPAVLELDALATTTLLAIGPGLPLLRTSPPS